jgi:hypothetical protein
VAERKARTDQGYDQRLVVKHDNLTEVDWLILWEGGVGLYN